MKTRKVKKQVSEKDRYAKAGLTNALGELPIGKKEVRELSQYFREAVYIEPELDYEFQHFFNRLF